MTSTGLERAAAVLAETSAHAEKRIADLPGPASRTPEQKAAAAAAHEEARALRAAFMDEHADEVYDALTGGRTRYPRLAELVEAAADSFPGLCPTPAQMADERRTARTCSTPCCGRRPAR